MEILHNVLNTVFNLKLYFYICDSIDHKSDISYDNCLNVIDKTGPWLQFHATKKNISPKSISTSCCSLIRVLHFLLTSQYDPS